MQNKDKGDGIEDSPLDMLLVILLDGASKEVVMPSSSCHLLLRWAWLHFKMLNLDERSLYLRHEGHQMKLKFMTPRQASVDQHRLKEKIQKERIAKEQK